MLAINGTLGTGLYWRGGQILELERWAPRRPPLFLASRPLAWAVVRSPKCSRIWPIPGALSMTSAGSSTWNLACCRHNLLVYLLSSRFPRWWLPRCRVGVLAGC